MKACDSLVLNMHGADLFHMLQCPWHRGHPFDQASDDDWCLCQ